MNSRRLYVHTDSRCHSLSIFCCQIRKGGSQHQKMMYVWGAAVPLTSMMTVLPGPNVFLAWNAFRLYSHYRALQGVRHLAALRTRSAALFCPSLELDRVLHADLAAQLP